MGYSDLEVCVDGCTGPDHIRSKGAIVSHLCKPLAVFRYNNKFSGIPSNLTRVRCMRTTTTCGVNEHPAAIIDFGKVLDPHHGAHGSALSLRSHKGDAELARRSVGAILLHQAAVYPEQPNDMVFRTPFVENSILFITTII